MSDLPNFVAESNRIEGIWAVTDAELVAHRTFLARDLIDVNAMERFVDAVAGVPLRSQFGQNVRVGGHVPPAGGPQIEKELRALLVVANTGEWSPFDVHVEYETLHPFLDGNGRSGRVLWAWMMHQIGRDPFELGFLHSWYYQSLDAWRQ